MVRKLLLAAAFCLAPIAAHAQAASVAFPAVNGVCGDCASGMSLPSLSDQSTWTLTFVPGATATQQTQAWTAFKSLTGAQWQALADAENSITIQSTGTPSLDGTYAIDPATRSSIDGIYAGIKDGDGLPGGGTTFIYKDANGGSHTFDTTSFPNFAKAVRDYLYALSQGQVPTQPVTIP